MTTLRLFLLLPLLAGCPRSLTEIDIACGDTGDDACRTFDLAVGGDDADAASWTAQASDAAEPTSLGRRTATVADWEPELGDTGDTAAEPVTWRVTAEAASASTFIDVGFHTFPALDERRTVWLTGTAFSGAADGPGCNLRVQFVGGCFKATGTETYAVSVDGEQQFTYAAGQTSIDGATLSPTVSASSKRLLADIVLPGQGSYDVRATKTSLTGTLLLTTCYTVDCSDAGVMATKVRCGP